MPTKLILFKQELLGAKQRNIKSGGSDGELDASNQNSIVHCLKILKSSNEIKLERVAGVVFLNPAPSECCMQ